MPATSTRPFIPQHQIHDAALELGYQPDETFCLKIGQLRELVRGRGTMECWVQGCVTGNLGPRRSFGSTWLVFVYMRCCSLPTTRLMPSCTRLAQFVVRWSVFLLGPAGCGKSAIWRTLMKAQNNAGEKTVYRPINPKAVTRNELYGYLHPQVGSRLAVPCVVPDD
jgi:hypothetical protein